MRTDRNRRKIAGEKSIKIAQLAIYPLLLALRFVVARDIKVAPELKKSKAGAPFVLYANHQSMLDPLIICASLPFKTIIKITPFRFFIENSYFHGLIKPFLHIMGGFPAHYDPHRPYGLQRAEELMSSGQTIVIFPPGIRTRKNIVKPGISVLAAKPNIRLIPIHIDWQSRWRCRVRVGGPFKGGTKYLPSELMQQVHDLT